MIDHKEDHRTIEITTPKGEKINFCNMFSCKKYGYQVEIKGLDKFD